ncbi:heavy-metal-associated domain-containing protein [Clostridium sp. MB40-C1]|uniref:heavy-metal-associated domain-containing protein n=1 Tax=Clostridium sp. MB40-C1 TaxID=3070996 RepID=UPI0027DED785|nr:heavy-metal-associated domain-containing protein [Clostridium sp. MB40-C1]WMJ79198.1 heavy-metal-associated domain-containing protein [Clostridium sp. MB40-C1]
MKKKLLVEGMSCQHCVKHVKDALMELEGVTNVDVDLEKKSALVDMEKSLDDSILKDAVEDAGYDVVKVENVNNGGCCCSGH